MAVVVELATPTFDGSTPQFSGLEHVIIPFPLQRPIPEQVVFEGEYPGLPPVPKIEVPEQLSQKGISGLVGNEKGPFMEKRVAEIIAVHPKVKEVVPHSRQDPQDGKGHDMTVIFVEDSRIAPMHIQSKSRQENVLNYRNRIARKLRKLGSKMTASEWLVLDRTIALNGAVVSEKEVLWRFILGAGKIIKQYDIVSRKYQYIDLFADEDMSAQPT